MKAFSELTSASQVNNEDLLAISQTSGSGYASKKTTVKDITDKSNLNLAEEYDSTSNYAVDDYVIYESVLYKCIASTTGTFDSTKWTSVVVTDEMGSGGGGGTGGHTIIDENGTSMTARSGLQFTGAVEVTDDNVNNKTIVDVLGGDFYNPVIYSTEERVIGVWTDGKPLYQKTIVLASSMSITSNTWTDIDNGDWSFVDTFVLGLMVNANGASVGFVAVDKNTNNNKLRILQTRSTDITCKSVTIQYTKSSDTAGSGQWTPQGVPTHHYSTDEQIVGTWNDKTVYGKLFELESSLLINADSWGNTPISNSDKSAIIDVKLWDTNGTLFTQIGANRDNSSGYVQILNSRNSAISINKIYLEYTKTS